MKTTFQKLPPKITSYRDYTGAAEQGGGAAGAMALAPPLQILLRRPCYKNFDNDIFRECLLHDLSQTDKVDNDLYKFLDVCINTLNTHALFKRKYSRGNHLYFMNKDLSKAIMTRTRLRNRFLKTDQMKTRKKYSKQRNYCVLLLTLRARIMFLKKHFFSLFFSNFHRP